MKEKGLHEGCIEQICRLYKDRLYSGGDIKVDEKGRIRIDDWEMKEEIQGYIKDKWPKVSTETLEEYGDFEGYRESFLKLFGFGFPGVNYDEEVEVERNLM